MNNIKTYVKRPETIRAIQFRKEDFDNYNRLIGMALIRRNETFFVEMKPFVWIEINDGDYIILRENNKYEVWAEMYIKRWFREVEEENKEIK
jgi:hypothetical protein